MATVRVLFFIICLVAFNRAGVYAGHLIKYSKYNYEQRRNSERLLGIARKEIGVREVTANSSARIDEFNAYVGFKKVAWCASFVSWCFGQAGFTQPKTAWSPALFPKERVVNDALPGMDNLLPGMVMGVYFPSLGRIAHCGWIEKAKGNWRITIEGNSSPDGSREGIGVYRRMRHKRSIARYANWLY